MMNPCRTLILLSLLPAFQAAVAADVRISGLRHRSENDMLLLLGDRLEHVRASSASEPLADDAAYMLREIMLRDGYSNAQVTWRIESAAQITLIVNEGHRRELGDVDITGVDSDLAGRLVRIYRGPSTKDVPMGLEGAPFREGDVETGLSLVKQELNARGYWSAAASVVGQTENAQGKVNISISVEPGPRYTILAPRFSGSGASLVEAKAAKPWIGRPADTERLNELRSRMQKSIASGGYASVQVQMDHQLEGTGFRPLFTVEAGKRMRLRKVTADGLRKTDPSRVLGRISKLEGSWYDGPRITELTKDLLMTGAFSSVRIERTEVGGDWVDATLHMKEAKARELSFAAGASSYYGPMVRMHYVDRNLWGRLFEFNAGAEVSARGLLGEVKIKDPWLLDTDVEASARAFALIHGREGYLAYEMGAEGALSWAYHKHNRIDCVAGLSAVTVSDDGLPDSALGESPYAHVFIRLAHTRDLRDSPILPTKGWHLQNYLQAGSIVGSTAVPYISTGMQAGWFREFGRFWQVGVGGEFGMILPTSSEDLPIESRFFNGGARSVRSYPERELGPDVNGYATGGEAMWNANVELVRKLSGPVKLVAFCDAGSLSQEIGSLSTADLEVATGLGLRLDLPIGPVRFDYGYNLTRDPGEPTGTFHFAIGLAF